MLEYCTAGLTSSGIGRVRPEAVSRGHAMVGPTTLHGEWSRHQATEVRRAVLREGDWGEAASPSPTATWAHSSSPAASPGSPMLARCCRLQKAQIRSILPPLVQRTLLLRNDCQPTCQPRAHCVGGRSHQVELSPSALRKPRPNHQGWPHLLLPFWDTLTCPPASSMSTFQTHPRSPQWPPRGAPVGAR